MLLCCNLNFPLKVGRFNLTVYVIKWVHDYLKLKKKKKKKQQNDDMGNISFLGKNSMSDKIFDEIIVTYYLLAKLIK